MASLQRNWSEAALLKVSLGKKKMLFSPPNSTPFKHLEANLIIIIIILNSTLKDKLFWMGPCSQAERNARFAFCVPTSAVEDVERWDVLVMQRSTQTGVYCRNASLFVSILQGNTKPHPWITYLYFSAVYPWNKYNKNCTTWWINTGPTNGCERGSNIYIKKKRSRWRNNQIKESIWKRKRTLKKGYWLTR